MLWFRVGEQVCVVFTLLFTIGILYAILDMVSKGAKTKAMDHDPVYNGTLLIYIVMIIFQIWINFTCIFGFFVSFKVWQNNYQMDHQLRHWFMMWLGSWCAALLGGLGVAIFAMVKGKEPQDEMSYIYEVFSRYATDKIFVASFEKYQRESSCCGIYGPDDWLMLQLRSAPGNSGGGGGGFQSLDYGFKTNPSTGHCHIKPPTMPMGCGKKILEEVHLKLKIIAGLTILESVIGMCAGVLAWYCFFYWLEKEVIVIPEDEISNLIVIEPESSTSTVVDDVYSNGGYLGPGPGGSLARYSHQPGSYYNPSRAPRGSHYSTGFDPGRSGSHNHHGSGSHNQYHSNDSQRFREYSSARQSHGSGQAHQNAGHLPSKNVASPAPPAINTTTFNSKSKSNANNDAVPSTSYASSTMKTLKSSKVSKGPTFLKSNHPASKKTTFKFNSSSKSKANKDSAPEPSHAPSSVKTTLFDTRTKSRAKESTGRFPSPVSHATNIAYMSKSTKKREQMLSAAGPFDANSRFKQNSIKIPNHTSYIKPHYAGYASIVGSGRPVTVAHMNPIIHNHNPHELHQKHSKNHQLHKQELALGGKVIGEMHVDHSKDPDPMNPKDDIAKGEKGHHDHHATIALVKNKNAPKPKSVMPKKGGAHHGQTGHLAEDIAEMSGKKAKKLIDDIVLPVEHNPPPTMGHGGYLAAHKKHAGYVNHGNEDTGLPPGAHLVNNGKEISAPSIDGSQAQNLIETIITPVAVNNTKGAPEIKAHYAGAPPHPHLNKNGHYLEEGGPGQHNKAHYLAGGHENAHYLPGAHENAHYLPGAHENAHYLPGMHEQGHYLGGSMEHHNRGSHEQAHYLGGSHEQAHYLGGSHEQAHYLGGNHEQAHYLGGSHEQAHYLGGSHEQAHYLGGNHEQAHYLGGSHEQAHYLGGSHEQAHYLGGSHEQAHYLGGNHEQAHYLGGSHEQAHYLGGSHEHAHYLGENHHDTGSHEHAHYLGENHHDTGNHDHAHYLGENHHDTGNHDHAHYLGENHYDTGNHEHAHYLGENHHPAGSHEHAHYLGENHHDTGNHEHAHYLGENHHDTGNHEHAHYLGENHHPTGSHEHAHYLGENHHHPGSHEHAHYIHEETYRHDENHEHEHLEHHHSRGSHDHGHHLDGKRDTEAHILYKNPIPIDDTD